MESEFPPNSTRQKQNLRSSKDLPPEAKKTEKQVTKIVQGKVVTRKRGVGSKMRDLFISADFNSVRQYVVADIVVPAVKDLISEALSGMVDRALFGESAHRHGHRSRRDPRGGLNYSRLSTERYRTLEARRPSISPRGRASHDFDEIVLDTRAEAEGVLGQMYDILEKYETVSVKDLYTMLGIDSFHTDDNWGWIDLKGANVRRVRDGYILDIARPEPLD
jgi:hypothetical protein